MNEKISEVNVMTRAQKKSMNQIGTNLSPPISKTIEKRSDQPRVVELLRKPSDDVEMILLEKDKYVLNDFHLLPTSGHAGIRMTNNIKRRYFWPGIDKDVLDFLKKCSICQKTKYSKYTKQPMTIGPFCPQHTTTYDDRCFSKDLGLRTKR